MTRSLLFLLFLIFILLPASTSAQSGAEIFVVPALHGLHKKNTNYNYDSLRTVIDRIDPDYIIIEIRQEDLHQDTVYLKKNYPIEMVAIPFWFRDKKIFGMDWLGKEIEGKPVPGNYWKETASIKKWEKELNADTLLRIELQACEDIAFDRLTTLSSGTFQELTNGEDEKLVLQYYQCMERVLLHTPHIRVTRYYQVRNYTMAERIAEIVDSNGDGKYVIVTGADHVPYLKMYLFKLGLGQAIRKHTGH